MTAANEAREINKLRAERDLTDAETQKINDLRAEVDRLQAAIETEERLGVVPTSQAAGSVDTPAIGMSTSQLRQFSLMRAIRALAARDWRAPSWSARPATQPPKRLGKEPQGFYLPYDWLRSEHSGIEQRAITASTGSSLIPTRSSDSSTCCATA